ncbi:MAG: exodeoxyribonuclease VII small subunit XseB [Rhodobacteraceae bacterium HLUCCA12]|nr:MAG: exodeoxyribonuclease VII small subunit XseB [Rhodobacteraceae bacterium HLUCCA12]
MKAVEEMTFEEALRELESVVGQLERGDVELEKSIALYERGAELKKHCEAKLSQAQARIEQITLAENGTPSGTADFDAG